MRQTIKPPGRVRCDMGRMRPQHLRFIQAPRTHSLHPGPVPCPLPPRVVTGRQVLATSEALAKRHPLDLSWPEMAQQKEATKTQDNLFGHCRNLLAHPLRQICKNRSTVTQGHIAPMSRPRHSMLDRRVLPAVQHPMSTVLYRVALVAPALSDQGQWHHNPPMSMEPSYQLPILPAWSAQVPAIFETCRN